MACNKWDALSDEVESTSGQTETSLTSYEEKVRSLFELCDSNNDGFVDSDDLLTICRELNLEHIFPNILEELDADKTGKIKYDDFLEKWFSLKNAVDLLTSGESKCGICVMTSSENSLDQASGSKETWEFDSGARDLSPVHNTLRRLIEAAGCSVSSSSSESILQLANKLHQTAVDSLRNEVSALNKQLKISRKECERLQKEIKNLKKCSRFDLQKQRYEEQITELHSVIAELNRKICRKSAEIIEEESASDVETTPSQPLHSPEKIYCERTEQNEDQISLWKYRLEKLQADNTVLHLRWQETKEYADRITMSLGQHESNTIAYDLALNAAKDALNYYHSILNLKTNPDNCPPKSLFKKEVRLLLDLKLQELKELEANISPIAFHSEPDKIQPTGYNSISDMEVAILIQEFKQEREENFMMQQRVLKLEECNKVLAKQLQAAEQTSLQSICSGKNEKIRKSKETLLEKNSNLPLKTLETEFLHMVEQHSVQVKTLKDRIKHLEDVISTSSTKANFK